MKVSELISVLSELEPDEPVVLSVRPHFAAEADYIPTADSVYPAIVTDVHGQTYNAVVIDADTTGA